MSSLSSSLSSGGGLQPSSTMYNTPVKDRLPFPNSTNPSPASAHLAMASTGSSQSLPPSATTGPSSSIQISPQSLSSESLLQQHASAIDPKLAALEQAVSDRNILSAQNSQLWKLIEKQRAGYNQILKELERIRGERDNYKAKVTALSSNGSSAERRKKTTGERGSRPSLDLPLATSTTPSSHPPSRGSLPRHNSDDPGMFRLTSRSHFRILTHLSFFFFKSHYTSYISAAPTALVSLFRANVCPLVGN